MSSSFSLIDGVGSSATHGIRPIFIVGVGRSGTSLLQSMLHAHPYISFLPETHFFRHYVARPKSLCGHEWAGAEAFRSTLADNEEYQRAGISEEELLTPFLNGKRTFDLAKVHARLLRLHRARENVLRRWREGSRA